MGKKINPKIFRLNTIGESSSKWFANAKDFPRILKEDVKIKKFIKIKFKNSGVSRIEIKRSSGNIEIIIHTARPGVIIGRGGAGVEGIKKEIKQTFFGNQKISITITITEISRPDLDAELILQGMTVQIEKRVPFRRVLKRAIEQVKRAGAKGVKVCVSGRLNGAEIARTEVLADGKIPAQTLRADIDYARGVVNTIYGTIGIKVWIYKGDIFADDLKKKEERANAPIKKSGKSKIVKKVINKK